MSTDPAISTWLQALEAGDEVAARELWSVYYPQLVQLAARRTRGVARRMADEEDIALSAFDSFCQGIRAGRFPDLSDRHDLWKLLVVITARKAADFAQYHRRQKRGGGHVRGDSVFASRPDMDGPVQGWNELVGPTPTPEFCSLLREQLQNLLSSLNDPILQAIALAKLEGYTNEEIAKQLNVVSRTIEPQIAAHPTSLVERGPSLNDPRGVDYSTLPFENAAQIDAACDAFERAWKSDEHTIPRLEDFLTHIPFEFRDVGLRELLIIELAYRRRRGLPSVPDDFQHRFPNQLLPAEPLGTAPSNEDHPKRLSTHDQLDKYSIISWLGAGGMGEVYRAHDRTLNRDVAIKLLLGRYRKNVHALARIRREAQALASLNHPNIVTIHEFVEWEDTAFLVLELLEGETLAQRLKRGSIHPVEAAQIAVSLAMGLAAAHERGIIHRDIKPQNIFFTANGIPKLLDLGLRLAEYSASDRIDTSRVTHIDSTMAGSRVGTTGYMSPEQIRGELVTAPSDIFSFGCVLYEMLEGHSPFARTTASATDTAILTEPAPQLQSARHPTARSLASIINRCLDKSATKRFPSAVELLAELRRIAAAPSGQTTKLRWLERLVTAAIVLSVIVLSVWLWKEQRVRKRIDALVSSAPIASSDDRSLEQLKIVVRELHHLQLANPSWRNNIESVIRGSVGSPEYHAYMLGHLSLEGGTNNDLKTAMTYFEKAIAIDPDFAAAYAALGECYYRRSNTYASPSEMMPHVQQFSQAALQRNPSLASAHVLLGIYEHRFRWNWSQAQEHFREALSLNPNSLLAHHMSGNSFVLAGKFAEGIRRLQWAHERDPESRVIAVDLALAYLYAGRIDEAQRHLDASLASDPDYFPARWALGELYMHRQDWPAAIRELQSACVLDDSPEAAAELAYALAKSGDQRAATALLRDLKAASRTRHVPPTAIAVAHIGLAQQAEALDALQLGFEQHDEWLVWLEVDPVFDDLRHNAAFEALRAALHSVATE